MIENEQVTFTAAVPTIWLMLFEYLEKNYQLTGASLFQYLSFRSAITFILAIIISTIFGKKIGNDFFEGKVTLPIILLYHQVYL